MIPRLEQYRHRWPVLPQRCMLYPRTLTLLHQRQALSRPEFQLHLIRCYVESIGEKINVTRISFVYESFSCQFDTSIEATDFVGPCAALPNAPTNVGLEMLSELLFVVIQVSISAKRREVVTMDDNTNVAGLMVKASRSVQQL